MDVIRRDMLLQDIDIHLAPLSLDADRVGLHLAEVPRLRDEVFLGSLALDTSPGQPPSDRPLVIIERNDHGLQWTPMGHQRDHERHGLG